MFKNLSIAHAGRAAVRAHQRCPGEPLKRIRKAGYAIASFDECLVVYDKTAGRPDMGRALQGVGAGSSVVVVRADLYSVGGDSAGAGKIVVEVQYPETQNVFGPCCPAAYPSSETPRAAEIVPICSSV